MVGVAYHKNGALSFPEMLIVKKYLSYFDSYEGLTGSWRSLDETNMVSEDMYDRFNLTFIEAFEVDSTFLQEVSLDWFGIVVVYHCANATDVDIFVL
jgi:hypothetical protein